MNDVSEAIIEEAEEDAEEGDLLEDTTVTASGYETPLGPKSSSEAITVGVRVRPNKEMEDNTLQIVNTQLIVDNDEKKVFNFDRVFKPDVSQEKVFEDLVQCKVQKFLEGFSSTVFAYGQTGTGKTFSMGTNNSMDNFGVQRNHPQKSGANIFLLRSRGAEAESVAQLPRDQPRKSL